MAEKTEADSPAEAPLALLPLLERIAVALEAMAVMLVNRESEKEDY